MPYFHHTDLGALSSLCGGSITQRKPTVIDTKGVHLIICVHGLEGNSADLRLIKTYLEMALMECPNCFSTSKVNHTSHIEIGTGIPLEV